MANGYLTLNDVYDPLGSALKVQQLSDARDRSRLQAMQLAEVKKSQQFKDSLSSVWQGLSGLAGQQVSPGTPATGTPAAIPQNATPALQRTPENAAQYAQNFPKQAIPASPDYQPGTPPENLPTPSPEKLKFLSMKGQQYINAGDDVAYQNLVEWGKSQPDLAPIMDKAGIFSVNVTGPGKSEVIYKNLTPEQYEKFKKLNPTIEKFNGPVKVGMDVVNGRQVLTKWEPAKDIEDAGKTKEQLIDSKLHGATPEIRKRAADNLTEMERYDVKVAGAKSTAIFEGKEKLALDAVKETINDPVAGPVMMSGALAQGMSPEKFANLTQSTRGIQGTEAKGFLMRAYSNYVQKALALPPSRVGAFLSARQNAYTANLGTQRKAQEFATLNNRAIEQATTMGSILQKESGALTQTGSRPRAAITAWAKNTVNDPKYGRFVVALNSYLSEYMKVVSGGALSVQQITDSARSKGQELLASSDNFETLNGKLDVMKQEMQGTKDSWDNAVATTYSVGAMTDITKPPATSGGAAPQAPAPPTESKAKTIVKTGKDKSGRKVVQYSDGSIDYANQP